MSALRADQESDPNSGAPSRLTSTDDAAAMRDAEAVVDRVAQDEEAAARMRERLLTAPIPAIEPDPEIAAVLEPGELVLAVRRGTILNPPATPEPASLPGYGGTLYLTSARLVHIGQVTVSIWLTDLEDVTLAGEQLLFTLAHGEGVSLRVDEPRVLRVVLSAARQADERASTDYVRPSR